VGLELRVRMEGGGMVQADMGATVEELAQLGHMEEEGQDMVLVLRVPMGPLLGAGMHGQAPRMAELVALVHTEVQEARRRVDMAALEGMRRRLVGSWWTGGRLVLMAAALVLSFVTSWAAPSPIVSTGAIPMGNSFPLEAREAREYWVELQR